MEIKILKNLWFSQYEHCSYRQPMSLEIIINAVDPKHKET